METSLLTTKLNIPPARPQLVTRPRLMEQLREGLMCNLVLVSAPAGFGKTTLLSDWVHLNQPPMLTAWVSLEVGENDPVRFWDYFIAALQTLQPSTGEIALALLHSPQPSSIESVLTALINDLIKITEDFILILDDYHYIESQPIHVGIIFLLEHMPPRMHLVIATRVDPPLRLGHFRGKGTLLEIGADDLRFSQEETTSLFAAMDTPPLSAESINALNTKAEGWVVGLKMAALYMRREKDILAFIAGFTGSQRYIMDYLLEEVLHQQTEEVQEFFLQTSVLERLTAPLCDYVTERSGSQEMLVKLESAFSGFLVPLDESHKWYRYHHLFAELLRHQLEVMSGAEEVALLQQRASQWCDDHKSPDEATRYALAARDWETAMRLIYTQSGERLRRGELNTLIDWLQVIPDELLHTRPRLYSKYAMALVEAGQFKPGEAALSYLERTAQADASLQGEVAISRSTLARRRGDIPLAIEMAEKALSLLPPDSFGMRSITSFWLGFIQYSRGLLEEARRLFSDAYEMGRQAGEYWTGSQGAVYLGVILWTRGRLREALEMVQQAVDLAGQLPAAALPRSAMAAFLYDYNDLEGSARSAQLSIELCRFGGQPMVLLESCFWLARARLAQGDVAGAMAAMENMDQAARLPGVDRAFRAYDAAWHVMFAIWQDDLASALDWGSRLQEYADVLPFDACYVPARLLIARGEKTLAAEKLQRLYEKAVQIKAQGFVIWLRIYQALAAATMSEALTFLGGALTLGKPEGFVRTFVDEGRSLSPLLRQAISQGIEPEYAAKLLTIIEAEERQRKAMGREVAPAPTTSGLLSERELEILRLLAAGLSNRQIAERLVISLGTAKTHVHNIFEKLNAKTRTQAVAQAREIRLF